MFIRDSERPLWDFWQSQLAAITSNDENDLSVRLETGLEHARAAAADGDPTARWRQYMLLAQLGRWDEIAPGATELVLLQTPDAVRIASHALYNTRDFVGCLAVLDEAPALFIGGEISPDLRSLRVLAQSASGALPEAIKTAREVFDESPTREAFLELSQLYLKVGDFKNFAILSRSHSTVSNLSAVDYLTLAFHLRIEDPGLALVLWRVAVSQGIDDDQVAVGFSIGDSLGADVELKTLGRRLAVLGAEGKGGVQAVGFQELLDWSVQRREFFDEVWGRLRRGDMPYHVALRVTPAGLARVFHRVPRETATRTDGTSAGPVFQRFGGRTAGSMPVVPGQEWRLNADVTAILNAAHFDLLPLIEAEFGQIRVPQDTVIALSAMENAIRPGQPHDIEARRHILSMVSAGKIERLELDPVTARQDTDGDLADGVLQLLRNAIANDSFVLDFLPPRSADSTHPAKILPAQYSVLLRDAHSVVDALKHCGALSAPEHLRAIEALGQRHGLPDEATIPAAKRLVCRSAVVRLLALADVLKLAAATFVLIIPASELKEDQSEVDNAAIDDADANWLGVLIKHIGDGLTRGTYAVLPQSVAEVPVSEEHEPTPAETVLFDLMQFAATESDVIWIDDRWAQSHEHRDGIRIAGTVDLLCWLRDAGKLSTAALASTLNDMRAADVRFVAFDAEELVAALGEAPIEGRRLVETRNLRVLRQYYARCLLEADILRSPAGSDEMPNAATEWGFLIRCSFAVENTMVRVWDIGPQDDAAARVEWLLSNMYTNDRGIHGAGELRTENNAVCLASASLVSLIVNSVVLDGDDGSLRQARRNYLQWLYQRVIRGRFNADVNFAGEVVDQLKGAITQSLATDEESHGTMALYLMERLWSDLPNDLRKLTEPDQGFLRKLGVSMKSVVEIGRGRVEWRIFWDTLSRVLRDRVPREVATIDGHPIRIELVSDRPIRFSAHCDTLKFVRRIEGEELGFLSESFAEREGNVGRVASWFDFPKSRRDELVAMVVGGHDPATRIETATKACKASGTAFYRRLYVSIKEGEMFGLMDTMPADADVLMNHLRISESDSSSELWTRSAERLVADVGVAQAANRLGGLPITLPKAFVAALAALPPVERRQSLRTIRKTWLASPVGLVHLLQLWSDLPQLTRHATKVRSRLARIVCSKSHRPVFEAWLATVRWVDEQFGFNESTRVLPRAIRLGLVWTHADRVFRILWTRGVTHEWIQSTFSRRGYAVSPELVFPDAAYTEDVAAPRHLRAEVFSLSVLTLICNDAAME